jgi:hypothetical protein
MGLAQGDLAIDLLGRAGPETADDQREIRGGQIGVMAVHVGVGRRVDPKSNRESVLHETSRIRRRPLAEAS